MSVRKRSFGIRVVPDWIAVPIGSGAHTPDDMARTVDAAREDGASELLVVTMSINHQQQAYSVPVGSLDATNHELALVDLVLFPESRR